MKIFCKIISTALVFLSISCTPDYYESLNDNSKFNISDIKSISIWPNHDKLIADGKAEIDLLPILMFEFGDRVPEYRITDDMLEYKTSDGLILSRHFSTDDESLIGKTLEIRMSLKGTDLVSDPINVDIIEPYEAPEKVTIPVVFHIIQTNSDIESYTGIYNSELIYAMLKRLNNVFAGKASNYSVGVDTQIEFKEALYSPRGEELREAGINRVAVNNIIIDNEDPEKAVDIYKFIEETGIAWPSDKYLNIWLVSDVENEVDGFCPGVVTNCTPKYYSSGILAENVLKGLEMTEFTDETVLDVNNQGIIYKLQELTNVKYYSSQSSFNELGFYLGIYLGLLPTSIATYTESMGNIDYCDDTIDFDWSSDLFKSTSLFYFQSLNIMDDNSGLHSAISKEQAIRIRWVLENCPDRSSWKSDFAFTGISK